MIYRLMCFNPLFIYVKKMLHTDTHMLFVLGIVKKAYLLIEVIELLDKSLKIQ